MFDPKSRVKLTGVYPQRNGSLSMGIIREFPDHATFREKENTLGWLDKLGVFLSLTLCNLANFDQLYLP